MTSTLQTRISAGPEPCDLAGTCRAMLFLQLEQLSTQASPRIVYYKEVPLLKKSKEKNHTHTVGNHCFWGQDRDVLEEHY